MAKVVRVLVYDGPEPFIKQTLTRPSAIQDVTRFNVGNQAGTLTIQSIVLDPAQNAYHEQIAALVDLITAEKEGDT